MAVTGMSVMAVRATRHVEADWREVSVQRWPRADGGWPVVEQ